ncbi:pre-mRNA cleavage complex II protein Clp1 [Colletotrichum orchidophilum]|uniref:Polynucleotide 5'-hydroxyl-kinase GRC3 n=1 Tax=Colletotrichum orchidophilum TaxID=1209926 RepID=A0A1G4ATV1_9PEZI|nr:pre-mRNA cleavage complex II protein Clp1 [Colletotrichum orchidophilum]OHE92599.1 pre-mRNA cleavage complex II protein Clp1 [Colletotrichum orchidophilum]
MSIPGLGHLVAPQPTSANQTRTIRLQPFWEWRFQVAFDTQITLKLLSGTAEKDGTELALQHLYTFAGTKSKILTLQGCELEVEGVLTDESVAEYPKPQDSPANSVLNLHFQLTAMRQRAAAERREGPRIAVCGPPTTGKTSLTRTLTSYAARVGAQPLVVNTDPKEGMLSLPGTLSASVVGTLLDVEAVDGWGTTPTSGPSQVPVKLPLVYYYGHASSEEDPAKYKELVSKMAATVTSRLGQDPEVQSAGMIIDTPAVTETNQVGMENFVHAVEELSVNIIIVLGSASLNAEISKRFSTERTSLGEQYSILLLEKSEGVVERDVGYMQQACEASIKEYFFGSIGQTLSPATQQVDFDSLAIYKLGDYSMYGGGADEGLMRVDPAQLMAHWTLAIVYASVKDSPETIRTANVMGYVYIADIDKEKRKLRILAPVSGRLGDRPLLLGKWPEPFINLLG